MKEVVEPGLFDIMAGPNSADLKIRNAGNPSPHEPEIAILAEDHDARVIVTCPGRNFVTLKIETDDGVTGLGDATLNGRELAVASYLADHVIPCLIGRDAHRIEDIWQYLYKGAYWRRGPVTMSAIAAVDMALWDIKGKIAGPAGLSAARRRVAARACMVYGHANGDDDRRDDRECARTTSARATRRSGCNRGVPGLASTYGVSKDRYFYEPADADLPTENLWSTEKYLRSCPNCSRRRARRWAGTSICSTTSITG